jgi:hypothetical protein
MKKHKLFAIILSFLFLTTAFAASSSSKTLPNASSDNVSNHFQPDLDALKYRPILTDTEVKTNNHNSNFSKLTWTSLNNSNFFVMDMLKKSNIKFSNSTE